MKNLYDVLSGWWAVKQELPKQVDVLAFATMGSYPEELTHGSAVLTRRAVELARLYPQATVTFATLGYNEPPDHEGRFKIQELARGYLHSADQAWNTSQEMAAVLDAAEQFSGAVAPRTLVFVTDQWHSRSALLAFKRELCERGLSTTVYIDVVPARSIIGPNNVIAALASPWKWALVNVLRHTILLLPFGHSVLKRLKVHQPTKSQ